MKKKKAKVHGRIWNQAVKATLREVKKYDGIIPSERARWAIIDGVYDAVAYKGEENPFPEHPSHPAGLLFG